MNTIKKLISQLLFFLIVFSTISNFLTYTYCVEEYTGEIEHLVVSGIISYPSVFSNAKNSTILEEENITSNEFSKILKSLYKNDYILVKPSECFEIKNNIIERKSLFIPKGKKPLILSIDNISYGKVGQVNKLILNEDGKVFSYTSKRSINERIHNDKEFITILEEFIDEHKDFSHNNAKGLILVSGNKGMFGYKTQKTNANSKYQVKKCAEIISTLKNNGWEFCAKNYNENKLNSNNMDFASGINKWNNNVKTIIGNTIFYSFSENYELVEDLGYKSNLLINCGFKVFLNENFETKTYTDQKFSNALIMNVKKINGVALRKHRNEFLNMFDSEIIYDRLNRKIPF